MAIQIDKAAQNIAKNLVGIRQRKGFSQLQLAKLSGLTRASVALLESREANPTLEVMLKLTQALRISIDELIANPRAICKLIRSIDVPVDRRSKNGVILRKLLPEKLPATEMDDLILEPDCFLTGSPHIEGPKEYFTCIKGEFSIGVLGEIFKLEKGDVLTFPGDKPHSYKNTGRITAQGISVVLFNTN